jgi:hypothetical protein
MKFHQHVEIWKWGILYAIQAMFNMYPVHTWWPVWRLLGTFSSSRHGPLYNTPSSPHPVITWSTRVRYSVMTESVNVCQHHPAACSHVKGRKPWRERRICPSWPWSALACKLTYTNRIVAWPGCMCLGQGQVAGIYEHPYEPSASINCAMISRLAS